MDTKTLHTLFSISIEELNKLLEDCPYPEIQLAVLHTIADNKTWANICTMNAEDAIPLLFSVIEQVQQRYPKNAWVFIFKARALWIKRRYQDALDCCMHALRHSTHGRDQGLAFSMLGQTYFICEKIPEAIAALNQAIHFHSLYAQSYIARALAFVVAAKEQNTLNFYTLARADVIAACTIRPDLKQRFDPLLEAIDGYLNALKSIDNA